MSDHELSEEIREAGAWYWADRVRDIETRLAEAERGAKELWAWRAVALEVARRGEGDGSIGVDETVDGALQFGAFFCGNMSMCDQDWYDSITELADAVAPGWRDEK